MPAAPSDVFELRVELAVIEPPIWRRLLVRADITLPDLHQVLQSAMPWQDCHLHQFLDGDRCYMARSPDGDKSPGEIDERGVPFSRLLDRVGKTCLYEYAFGDGWEHRIRLESIRQLQPGETSPACLDGARACPPEDCGGPLGYQDLLEAVAGGRSTRHKDLREWIGGSFDAKRFDRAAVNRTLALLRARAAHRRSRGADGRKRARP